MALKQILSKKKTGKIKSSAAVESKHSNVVSIKQGLADIKAGKMLVVIDDEERENEGDLVLAADKVTTEAINFMITHGKGLVCVPIEKKRLFELDLPQMSSDNQEYHRTKFSISVDSSTVTTGISAKERAHTIKDLVNPKKTKSNFRKPGHIFPLQSEAGGVLKRAGHTEAAVDLARLCGFTPAGVICEIIKEDGSMARLPDLKVFAAQHGINIIKIADLIKYRLKKEKVVRRESEATVNTALYGPLRIIAYTSFSDNNTHLAIVKGKVAGKKNVLVRVHSECFTGDVLASTLCDCGEQLQKALKAINEAGEGVVVYLKQEGRGIGIARKLEAYNLQAKGLNTVEANEKLGFPADLRDYGVGANILKDLGLSSLNVMTNNPKKLIGLEGYGLQIASRIPLWTDKTNDNANYLRTKQEQMGHLD